MDVRNRSTVRRIPEGRAELRFPFPVFSPIFDGTNLSLVERRASCCMVGAGSCQVHNI